LLCVSAEIVVEYCSFQPSQPPQTMFISSPFIVFVVSNFKLPISPTRLIVMLLFACCVVNGMNMCQGRLSIGGLPLSSFGPLLTLAHLAIVNLSIPTSLNDASITVYCIGRCVIIASSVFGPPVLCVVLVKTTELLGCIGTEEPIVPPRISPSNSLR
jgi:hypothetical protein